MKVGKLNFVATRIPNSAEIRTVINAAWPCHRMRSYSVRGSADLMIRSSAAYLFAGGCGIRLTALSEMRLLSPTKARLLQFGIGLSRHIFFAMPGNQIVDYLFLLLRIDRCSVTFDHLVYLDCPGLSRKCRLVKHISRRM